MEYMKKTIWIILGISLFIIMCNNNEEGKNITGQYKVTSYQINNDDTLFGQSGKNLVEGLLTLVVYENIPKVNKILIHQDSILFFNDSSGLIDKVNYKIHKTINDTVIFLVYQKECKLYPLKETNHYRLCGHNVCFEVIKE